jgi:DNA-binding response OmpR family regulator
MKILVVDDKHTLSDLLAQFLGQKHKVTTKTNGLEALEWLQQGDIPDLIISDLEMPELDGYGLISKVRASGYFSDIPIIVLSCRDSSADRIRCLKLGANDFMVKPFNPEELSIRIDNILELNPVGKFNIRGIRPHNSYVA